LWLDYGKIAGQLQPLESPLHCLRGWLDIPLRNHHAAASRDPHDRKSIQSRLSKPGKHCMVSRVKHKIAGKAAMRIPSTLAATTSL
jgi:hypothetical protein